MGTEPWSQRLGMLMRLSRILREDGRAVIIAADHRQRGIQTGMDRFEVLCNNILSALRHADALVTTREPMASLISSHEEIRGKGLLLSLNRTGLSGSAFENDDRPVADPRTAVRWGLDGAKLLLRIDPSDPATDSQLETCGRICQTCEELDLPLILEPLYSRRVGGEIKVETTPEKVRYAAIIANDFHVPILKLPYPSAKTRAARRKTLREVVDAVSAKVMVLGGGKMPLKQFLSLAEDSMMEGASGLVVGRNVLLDRSPALVTCALKHIVHGGEDASTALEAARREVGR